MKKIIRKKLYNTETANTLEVRHFSYFGDSAGYEERLLQTKKGDFFLYGNGGADSKYPTETIIPMEEKEAKDWQKV